MPPRNLVRTTLTWILVGCIGAIVVAVVGEWFIEVARDKGWYADAGRRWDQIVGAVTAFVISGAVLYPLTALSGLVAGLWVDTWLARKERDLAVIFKSSAKKESPKEQTKEERVTLIMQDMSDCARALGEAVGSQQRFACNVALSRAEAFLLQLSRASDISIPHLRDEDEETGCLRATKFILDLMPFVFLDDEGGMRERAANLVPRLNAMKAPELRRILGTE